ncbi:MAG: SDR family NAD(P)-dependent oxidoreductase [Rickettsiales bacterium]|nr:SDR family NAD(P)-dependent oxidoreductase [Rickettsiales bacterium]
MTYIWVIGATSAIGEAICHELATRQSDLQLTITGRSEEKLHAVKNDLKARYEIEAKPQSLDLTSSTFSSDDLVSQATQYDIIYLLPGMMTDEESMDANTIDQMIQVNFAKMAELIIPIAKQMAEKQSGELIIISSVAGDRGRKSNQLYSACKAALTTLSEGLYHKYWQTGAFIMTVKPGYVDTPLTDHIQSMLKVSPQSVAKKILDAQAKKQPVLYVPWFWRYIMFIIRHIPNGLFKHLSI